MKEKIEIILAVSFFASVYALIALFQASWPLHSLLLSVPNHWLWFGGVCLGSVLILGALNGGLESRPSGESSNDREERKPDHRKPYYQAQMLNNASMWIEVYTCASDTMAINYGVTNREKMPLRTARAVRVIEGVSKAVVWSG